MRRVFQSIGLLVSNCIFSSRTRELRQQRVGLRKEIHAVNPVSTRLQIYAHRQLAQCLKDTVQLQAATADLWGRKPVLRRATYQDRNAYLTEVTRTAVHAPIKDTVRKPLLGPPRRQAKGTLELPAIKVEDGSVAPDQSAADDRWLRHFSAIEDGAPIDPDRRAVECYRRVPKASES